MSYQDLKKAMSLAPKCRFFTTDGGKSKEDILKSEKLLEVKFSRQCTEFYEKFGYLSFFGSEVYGIDPEDDSGILAGNSVAYAIHDRKKYNLPREWIPLYDFDDGSMAYLDYASQNLKGEPRVIMCIYNGIEYEKQEVLAEDLGAFLLHLVQVELASQ